MKNLLILCSFFLTINVFGQNQTKLNPADYTSFAVRTKAFDGKAKLITPNKFLSVYYIKPNSQIRLLFEGGKKLTPEQKKVIKIRVSATLINSKGEEKPIEIFGFVSVNKKMKEKKSSSDATLFDYDITSYIVSGDNLQDTEIDISSEQLQQGDKIKISVQNVQTNDIKDTAKIGATKTDTVATTGFVTIFEVDDYGFKTGPSSGFAWLKTQANKSINFQASPWLGYSFYYRPSKGGAIWKQILSPAFGPEASVVQVGSLVYIGIGGQVSLLANTVKISYGQLLNYPDKGGYLTIGLNFVDSIETLTNLVKSK